MFKDLIKIEYLWGKLRIALVKDKMKVLVVDDLFMYKRGKNY